MGGSNVDTALKVEQKLQKLLTASQRIPAPYKTVAEFRKWFLQYFRKQNSKNLELPLDKFAVFYINAVRKQTYQHLRSPEANDKPMPMSMPLPSSSSSSTATSTSALASAATVEEQSRSKLIPPTTPIAQDKYAIFSGNHTPVSSNKCSTPYRRGNGQRRSIERSFGAVSNSSFEKSRNSTSDGGSFCLGDFLLSPNGNSGGRHGNSHKKKSQSQQTTTAATSTTTTPKSAGSKKGKKRVVPITIGGKFNDLNACNNSSSPFGGVHDRPLNQDCNEIFMQAAAMELSDLVEERKSIGRDLNELSTAIKAATPTKAKKTIKVSEVTQAMQKVTLETSTLDDASCILEISEDARNVLRLLANIYGLLMDMNFVSNVLNEFSFLMNLINANFQALTPPTEIAESLVGLQTLKLSINGVYFAVYVLESQQHTLARLDTKSLNVVLQCDRLEHLAPLLKAKLNVAYEQKQSLANHLEQQQILPIDNSFKNVCFKEDSDSRKFFSSTTEFSAFKTQRDLFYILLKLWEKNHLNPAWSFNSELSPKVREIFRQSEHPVNMSHFAKLFVSQLLISASDKTSPKDLGFETEDFDRQKFNKLAQRLVAPSSFSVDYQFPREQAFFRDFIVESRSLSFIEQLKMLIFSELITLNDSTLEHLNLNLMNASEECNHERHGLNEFIVEPSVLSSMLILAKFLGFVIALPYQGYTTAATTNGEAQNSQLTQRYQLKMRQMFREPFDVCQLLDIAMANGRLLITLPWLVQYMTMLDAVTLQLDSYANALKKMFALYAIIGGAHYENDDLRLSISPMAAFIVRCCLGGLFEQKPSIAAEYYNFRAAMCYSVYDDASKILQKINPSSTPDQQACAMLESVFAVGCPFLAEFRVSIRPSKYSLTKYVSRSGRYRHITPYVTDTSNSTTPSTTQQASPNTPMPPSSLDECFNTEKQRQRRLMESFLHTQNSSMRRLIVFLTERTYKCVVRDLQHHILLPSKEAADRRVNEITSKNYDTVLAEVQTIYRTARDDAIKQWDNEVGGLLRKRVTQSLDALLSVETTPIVKKAYAWRIQSDASIRISQWRHMNLFKNDFYCNDFEELTEKVCKANTNRPKQTNGSVQQSSEMKLVKAIPSISDLLEEMQQWLYITSSMSCMIVSPLHFPANIQQRTQQHSTIDEALIDFMARITDSFENLLPTIYYRLIGSGMIQVIQHLIVAQPAALTSSLIEAFCKFCLNETLRNADKNVTANATTSQTEQAQIEPTIYTDDPYPPGCSFTAELTTIYHTLISASFIQSLNARRICFDKLKELFRSMVMEKIISIDFINELFIGVFKADLCQETLNETSMLLSGLANEVGNYDSCSNNDSKELNDDGQKSKLLMEVLADFSRDIDDF